MWGKGGVSKKKGKFRKTKRKKPQGKREGQGLGTKPTLNRARIGGGGGKKKRVSPNIIEVLLEQTEKKTFR